MPLQQAEQQLTWRPGQGPVLRLQQQGLARGRAVEQVPRAEALRQQLSQAVGLPGRAEVQPDLVLLVEERG